MATRVYNNINYSLISIILVYFIHISYFASHNPNAMDIALDVQTMSKCIWIILSGKGMESQRQIESLGVGIN